jgi:hypothetical protein
MVQVHAVQLKDPVRMESGRAAEGVPDMRARPARNIVDAVRLVAEAWPLIAAECRSALGGELHYQAMAYHCLRRAGLPATQLGMNVKQWIDAPVTPLFRALDARKQVGFQGGFEPIPDIVIFRPAIGGDWRRRNRQATLRHMLLAIEVKASERADGRLGAGEVIRDIRKLAAHRDELRNRGGDMHPVMMVIDTAPLAEERMPAAKLDLASAAAQAQGVSFLYVSPMVARMELAVALPEEKLAQLAFDFMTG